MLKFYTMTRLIKFVLPIALLTCCMQTAFCQQPLVVFLVRHAEKADTSRDPKLSTAGNARAAALATTLRDANIQHVHSTNFIRTMKTATPLANKLGVKVGQYAVGNLPAFIKKMKSSGGRHLVVGHSNTTPDLVKLLGGEPGTKIQEKEYDRLYIVSIDKDGVVSTVLLRFGTTFVEADKKKGQNPKEAQQGKKVSKSS